MSLVLCLRSGNVEWAHNLLILVMFDSLNFYLQFLSLPQYTSIAIDQRHSDKPQYTDLSWETLTGKKTQQTSLYIRYYNEEPYKEDKRIESPLSNPNAKDRTINPNAKNSKL